MFDDDFDDLTFNSDCSTAFSLQGVAEPGSRNQKTNSLKSQGPRPLSETLNQPISDFGTFSSRGENNYHTALNILDRAADETVGFLEKNKVVDPLQFLDKAGIGNGFSYRQLRAPSALAYFLFQIFAVWGQFHLFADVSTHSNAYKTLYDDECTGSVDSDNNSNTRNGVCLGSKKSWSSVFDGSLRIPYSENSDTTPSGEHSTTFTFQTQSSIPTFMVGVEPLSPHNHLRYSVKVEKADYTFVSWKTTPRMATSHSLGGQQYGVFIEDSVSINARSRYGPENYMNAGIMPISNYNMDGTNMNSTNSDGYMNGISQNRVESHPITWRGRINIIDHHWGPEAANFHVYVGDSQLPHLDLFDKQPRCSFSKSWENFTDMKGPSLFHYIELFHSLILAALAAQVLALCLVAYRYLRFAQSSRLFTRLSFLKFLTVDLWQQAAVILYLHAWYSQDGLKCQMCMIEHEYCSVPGSGSSLMESDNALSWKNLIVIASLLLSAASTQLLLVEKGTNASCDSCIADDDEMDCCCISVWRLSAFALCTLPLSISFLMLGHETFLRSYNNNLVYTGVLFNCFLGMTTFLVLMMSACTPSEDYDIDYL